MRALAALVHGKRWFMPLNILMSYVIGSILGWILLKVVHVSHTLRGLVFGCCVAGNIGTLMLVIVTSICEEKGSPFGDGNVCKDHALAFASLSFAIGGIYFWSYVYRIVRIVPSQICNINSDDDPTPPPLPSSSLSDPITADTKNKVRKLVEEISSLIKDVAGKFLNLKPLLAPSNVAVIVGLAIGVTPLLRKALVGPSAPLHILHDTASLLGAAFIPTITLITGANLLKGLSNKSDLKYSAILLIGVIRYVMMPIMGVAIVKGGVRVGMIPSDEPLYQFVLLLQYSVPPSINMSKFHRFMSHFMIYSLCSVLYTSDTIFGMT
ncbi:protein PIN-LIKES 1-like [Neltuma alba]|uniref:protein PIN-LIKES 1-like n=1 Tax=Neltuma alba TaxID=207710 RepID=UPI0010A304B8|nr:protein PIN-LIKES 1-like [Prosopis alba]